MIGWTLQWQAQPGPNNIAAMAQSLTYPPSGAQSFAQTGSQCFAHQTAIAHGIRVGLCGRLDCRDDLALALGLSTSEAAVTSDASLLAQSIAKYGERLWPWLQGEFAAFAMLADQQLWLIRDPVGTVPLYFAETDAGLIAGTEIKALLASDLIEPSPDQQGLADCVLGRFALNNAERTCFTHIQSLPPGMVLRGTPQGLQQHVYWDFDLPAVTRAAKVEDYAGLLRESFNRAVARRLPRHGSTGVFVSGGLDSSAVYASACQLQAGSVQGLTFTSPSGSPADEIYYIEQLEQAFGQTMARVPTETDERFHAEASTRVQMGELPILDTLWSTTRSGLEHFAERGTRVVLSGLFGDQATFATGYWHDLFRRGRWVKLWRHGRQAARWYGPGEGQQLQRQFAWQTLRNALPTAWRPTLKKWWHQRRPPLRQAAWFTDQFLAQVTTRGEPAPWPEQAATQQARAIYLQIRSKFHQNCLEWNYKLAAASGVRMSYPFFDRDFLRAVLAIPGPMLATNGVPRGLMRIAMRGIVPEAILHRRDKADFTHFDLELLRTQAPEFRQHLSSQLLAQQWQLVRPELTALMPSDTAIAQAQDCRQVWEMTDILALELWLRSFGMTRTGRPA